MPGIILGIRELCGNNQGCTGIIARAYCARRVGIARPRRCMELIEGPELVDDTIDTISPVTSLRAPKASELARKRKNIESSVMLQYNKH